MFSISRLFFNDIRLGGIAIMTWLVSSSLFYFILFFITFVLLLCFVFISFHFIIFREKKINQFRLVYFLLIFYYTLRDFRFIWFGSILLLCLLGKKYIYIFMKSATKTQKFLIKYLGISAFFFFSFSEIIHSLLTSSSLLSSFSSSSSSSYSG